MSFSLVMIISSFTRLPASWKREMFWFMETVGGLLTCITLFKMKTTWSVPLLLFVILLTCIFILLLLYLYTSTSVSLYFYFCIFILLLLYLYTSTPVSLYFYLCIFILLLLYLYTFTFAHTVIFDVVPHSCPFRTLH